ncbi:MAG: sodium-dependent transporter [Clostridiales Family XIII bacterium]|jgi:NSS family neurotransmitter:Na+ symporter|nr:sodium-dependent transporter [Clostridiales Family XIII bacterium]
MSGKNEQNHKHSEHKIINEYKHDFQESTHKPEAGDTRSSFSNRIGFVLAAAGSAVGLGNIWRFPYLAAKYGGGSFLIVYLLLVISFGFTLMVTEIALGRKTGKSAIQAFSMLQHKWGFVGIICAAIPIIITPYYCVIGGWVAKFFVAFVTGQGTASAADGYFNNFIGGTFSPLIWFVIYLALTCVVVLLGVKDGIERASRILMPLLIAFLIGITIYSFTMDGALEGIKFYFTPDLSKFTPALFLAAMGQMFYSMSLAMGIMITYGSYMKKSDHIEASVKQIEWFDTGVAMLAGLMIVPAVFAFSGGDENAVNAGPGMMFVTMPKMFTSMGISGNIVGAIFFLLVLFAALTSSISLLETVVSIFADKLRISRLKACIISFSLTFVLGVPSALGFGKLSMISIGGMSFLDMCDFITNSVLMPIVALLTCIFVGFVIKPSTVISEIETNGIFKRKGLYIVFIKYVAPIMVLAILISSVMNSLGLITL